MAVYYRGVTSGKHGGAYAPNEFPKENYKRGGEKVKRIINFWPQ